MSDSLRDQLLQAGFEAPKEQERPKRQPKAKSGRGAKNHTGKQVGKSNKRQPEKRQQNRTHPPSAQPQKAKETEAAEALIARRKAIKSEIKALIEASAAKEFQGESVYRFILNKRIRELHVNEDIRQQLVAGTLVITRLNGTTWLVPEATAAAIRELNPDWAVVTPAPETSEDTSGYEDFPVPDGLQW